MPPQTPGSVSALVAAAADLTTALLAHDSARRNHSAAVARRAQRLAVTVATSDAGVLVAAGWLHDIGYAPAVRGAGFHPLDGGRWLRDHGWDLRLAGLVAHHSGARYIAAVRDLSAELDEFGYVQDPVSDALTVADQTIGPGGHPMSIDHGRDAAPTRTGLPQRPRPPGPRGLHPRRRRPRRRPAPRGAPAAPCLTLGFQAEPVSGDPGQHALTRPSRYRTAGWTLWQLRTENEKTNSTWTPVS